MNQWNVDWAKMTKIDKGLEAKAIFSDSDWESTVANVLHWCMSNYVFFIVLGIILLGLCVLCICLFVKRSKEAAQAEVAGLVTWNCPVCGETNKRSKGACVKCGTLAPRD